ncbi:cyclohexanecarboxylate-CoA ligase [Rhodococcus sp. HNM0563]|uniref:AMP-binding protein n=1 Tax=Rhodococcus sp. HNM0563 TaxID=2716339 RepID=UPI00146F7FEA|nr:AMP-binding protein [Rhodococcus sp. HNM0563]NLU61960.1 cyclohexanecarboxylate-CoA ligase [Rhodococcus sp. HNM0563]
MRQIPPELVERYEKEGWWTRDTLGDLLARGLKSAPDAEFRVFSDVRPWEGTFADVDLVARRLASGLHKRGVGPGDTVAFQLPNWMEAAAVFWASSFLGAAVVPIVHFYGRKELSYILGEAKPKAFVSAERFGNMEFQPDLCADIPIVGVVGQASFEDLLDDEPFEGVLPADTAGPALLAFTSGTTSNPKGVIHTHRTIGCETRQLAARYPADRGKQLTAAPVGHFIGMVNAFLIPILDGSPINLLDVWNPQRALELMESDALVVGGGATYFMTSLVDHPHFAPERHIPFMKYAGLGGSTVPAAVTRRLADYGITVFRAYGSTEHPSITSSLSTDPEDKRLYTDGNPTPGVEIRLTDEGEILSRGPDLCAGYTDPALTAKAFDDEGWYHTGDIGVLDDDGYLTITDRKADFIIRGGENISALEVEEVLLTLPSVAEAAVVSAPDERLGEHAAAVLRLHSGHALPSLDDVRAHFTQAGIAKQKWPEELHKVTDFPRTASGKIQKFLVRKDIAARIGRE